MVHTIEENTTSMTVQYDQAEVGVGNNQAGRGRAKGGGKHGRNTESSGKGGARYRSREDRTPFVLQYADYFTGDSGGSSKDREKGKKGGKKSGTGEKKTDKTIIKVESGIEDDKMGMVSRNYSIHEESERKMIESTEDVKPQAIKTASLEQKFTKVQTVSDSECSTDDDEYDDFIDIDGDEEYLEKMSDYSKYVPVTIPYQNARHLNMTVGNALFSGDDDEDDAPVKKKGYTRCDQESFLLQLPSNLMIRESAKKEVHNVDYEDINVDLTKEDGDTGSSAVDSNEGSIFEKNKMNAAIRPGKIGKLQQYKSGKCYLVTNDGKRYIINGGMPVNFLQYLIKITSSNDTDTNQQSCASSESLNFNAEPSTKHTFIKKESDTIKDSGTNNDLYFISKINTKLIITPDFDIGEKTPRISSESNMIHDSIANTYMHTGDLAAPDMPVGALPSNTTTGPSIVASAPSKGKERDKQKDRNNKSEKLPVSSGVETAVEALVSISAVVSKDRAESDADLSKISGGGVEKKRTKTTAATATYLPTTKGKMK